MIEQAHAATGSYVVVEPIQLQCGSCGQMMAISPEHLGAQVQCPHCQAIVQTPAPGPGMASAGADLGAPPIPSFAANEHESIFGQSEPSDDLFGGGPVPRIEMPVEQAPPPPVSTSAPTVSMEPAPVDYTRPAPHQVDSAPAPYSEQPAESPEEELAPFVPRKLDTKSMFVPILLIFLVPYAIFTTTFIAYLLYSWPKDNPLKALPDPAGKGGPRLQVKHDYPLDKDMKTGLGKPIQVGAIEVTPLKVKHNSYGDLVLVFKAKNLSSDLVFNPISLDYMKYSKKSLDSGRPYTFLERLSKEKLKPIYGGDLEWLKGAPGQERPFDGDIGPGDEAIIQLTTEADYRNREVANVMKSTEKLLWRVQVRRGFVPVDGKQIAATTVIGVEFTARDIVKERTERQDDG